MKLAFSLVLKDDGSAEATLGDIAAAGFDGVEPTFGLEGTLPVASDARASAERLKKLAEKAGLAIPSMRGGPGFWSTFASSDSGKRKRARELAEAALDAVQIMGGDTLLIVPGQWEETQTYAQVWETALETARGVAQLAEKRGIKVGLENVENRFLYSPREWKEFLDAVGSERVRMYFDAGNVVYLGTGHPQQWIVELGKRYITRIHFKDALAGQVKWLGEGAVKWMEVSKAIEAIGYDDWIGIELNLPEDGAAAMLASTYKAAVEILK